MTLTSVDGGTKAQKGKTYLAKISQPAKTNTGIQIQAHVAPELSATALNTPRLE